jgi:hypothetical protein
MNDDVRFESLVAGPMEGVPKIPCDVGRGLGWFRWSVKFFKRCNLEALFDLTGY